MTVICLIISWIFVSITSCRSQCVTETLDDTKFLINVTEHIEGESIDCIVIPYKMTFPQDKVTGPYKKMLFQGDPSNIVTTDVVSGVDSDTEHDFTLNELPQGEYEFGFKLEWGCNQTYIFSKKVHISVSALTRKPDVWAFSLVEGETEILNCVPPRSCSGEERLSWKWIKADGQSTELHRTRGEIYGNMQGSTFTYVLPIRPTADHHNTNITCVAKYKYQVVETTVTLTVKFSPKILNDSHCLVRGELLVCVCISWGNPLSPVVWPFKTLPDYSITKFNNNQTVSSTISLPAAEYHNTTVKCFSSNELGQAETEILIQNSTEDVELNYEKKRIESTFHSSQNSSDESGLNYEKQAFESALPWIKAVSVSLNLVFITATIVYIYQRRKNKQKKLCEETKTYESLRRADVEEEYSVISSRPR